jgi:hypothetical protein
MERPCFFLVVGAETRTRAIRDSVRHAECRRCFMDHVVIAEHITRPWRRAPRAGAGMSSRHGRAEKITSFAESTVPQARTKQSRSQHPLSADRGDQVKDDLRLFLNPHLGSSARATNTGITSRWSILTGLSGYRASLCVRRWRRIMSVKLAVSQCRTSDSGRFRSEMTRLFTGHPCYRS